MDQGEAPGGETGKEHCHVCIQEGAEGLVSMVQVDWEEGVWGQLENEEEDAGSD